MGKYFTSTCIYSLALVGCDCLNMQILTAPDSLPIGPDAVLTALVVSASDPAPDIPVKDNSDPKLAEGVEELCAIFLTVLQVALEFSDSEVKTSSVVFSLNEGLNLMILVTTYPLICLFIFLIV